MYYIMYILTLVRDDEGCMMMMMMMMLLWGFITLKC